MVLDYTSCNIDYALETPQPASVTNDDLFAHSYGPNCPVNEMTTAFTFSALSPVNLPHTTQGDVSLGEVPALLGSSSKLSLRMNPTTEDAFESTTT
jgi:hypothetical protein